jgi:hypothetical protein
MAAAWYGLSSINLTPIKSLIAADPADVDGYSVQPSSVTLAQFIQLFRPSPDSIYIFLSLLAAWYALFSIFLVLICISCLLIPHPADADGYSVQPSSVTLDYYSVHPAVQTVP